MSGLILGINFAIVPQVNPITNPSFRRISWIPAFAGTTVAWVAIVKRQLPWKPGVYIPGKARYSKSRYNRINPARVINGKGLDGNGK